jgi:hypothetical protein
MRASPTGSRAAAACYRCFCFLDKALRRACYPPSPSCLIRRRRFHRLRHRQQQLLLGDLGFLKSLSAAAARQALQSSHRAEAVAANPRRHARTATGMHTMQHPRHSHSVTDIVDRRYYVSDGQILLKDDGGIRVKAETEVLFRGVCFCMLTVTCASLNSIRRLHYLSLLSPIALPAAQV